MISLNSLPVPADLPIESSPAENGHLAASIKRKDEQIRRVHYGVENGAQVLTTPQLARARPALPWPGE